MSIGNKVIIGHGAVVIGSKIGNNCIIGQGAVIQEGSVIQDGSIVAAGSTVLPETFIKTNQFYAGNPAVYIRDVTEEEQVEHVKVRSISFYFTLCYILNVEY